MEKYYDLIQKGLGKKGERIRIDSFQKGLELRSMEELDREDYKRCLATSEWISSHYESEVALKNMVICYNALKQPQKAEHCLSMIDKLQKRNSPSKKQGIEGHPLYRMFYGWKAGW